RKLGDHLGFEWDPEMSITTAGGLVTELLDRIPRAGDSVVWEGYRFDVLSASETRAERIRITALPTGGDTG
ncbi:MAG TPA: transporter associated domain-containing protein, partial [Gammaproteobacteria bacterium]